MSESNALNVDQRFGRRVRQVREGLMIAQDALAETMRSIYGVQWHQTTVAKVEAGTRPVKLSEAVALSHALATDLHALLDMVPYVEQPRHSQQRARRDEVQRIIRQAQLRLSELDNQGWPDGEAETPEGEAPIFADVLAERTGVTPAFLNGVPVFVRKTDGRRPAGQDEDERPNGGGTG